MDYLHCSVCLASHTTDDWSVHPCGHCFHTKCISKCHKRKKECPVCRDPMEHPSEPLARLYGIRTCSDPGQTQPEDCEMNREQEDQSTTCMQLAKELSEATAKLEAKQEEQTKLQQWAASLAEELEKSRVRCRRASDETKKHMQCVNDYKQQTMELRTKLKIMERNVLEKRLLEPGPAPIDAKGLQAFMAEIQRVHGEKAQDPLVRSLMTTAMKFKHDFQELKTVFNREIKSLQVEKKKVSDNAARLQIENAELRNQVESLKNQRQRNLPAEGPDPGSRMLHDGLAAQWENDCVVDDLEIQDDESVVVPAAHQPGEQKPSRVPSFLVRPGLGSRPPSLASGPSAHGSFILQGADGRGGRTTTTAPVLRASSSLLNAVALKPKPSKHNLIPAARAVPAAKRRRNDYTKQVASHDIANFFRSKENFL